MLPITRKVYDFIKNKAESMYDYYKRIRMRRNEILKFRDPRRVEIYSKINLSKEQKNAIDELFINNYGKKLPHIWHRHYTAFTGKFDVNYFPELLYIPKFEYFMNSVKGYGKTFEDKNVLPLLAKAVGIKTPKMFLNCSSGTLRDSEYRTINEEKAISILENLGKTFIKPSIDTGSGRGCFIVDFNAGIDKVSGLTVKEILNKLGDNFVIQERLECLDSIKAIYPDGVCTFRIITYCWKGKIIVTPSILRIGVNGHFLDNAHAGGIFIAVDKDGTLHKTAFTEFKTEYIKHPNTGLIFENYKIELFPEVINAAVKMHEALIQLGVINWDFTIGKDGIPVLIEANVNGGSIWLSQMAHGKGIFEDNTAEILQWISKMEKLPIDERVKHRFGE